MHRFRLHLGLLLCIGLVACTPDRRNSLNGASNQASFIVKELTGSSERGKVREGSPWKVATSIRAGFYACLQDGASNQYIRKQDFYVGVPGTSTGYKVKTSEYKKKE